jgi:hypothetical protein
VIVAEYLKMRQKIDPVIVDLINLTDRLVALFRQNGSAEGRLQQLSDKFLLLAERLRKTVPPIELEDIRNAPEFLIETEGAAASVAAARVISKFLAHTELEIKTSTAQMISELMGMARDLRQVLPSRLEFEIVGDNYPGLGYELLTRLKELDVDISRFHAEGEGQGMAYVRFELKPRSNFEQLMISNIAEIFGHVTVTPLEEDGPVSSLPPKK